MIPITRPALPELDEYVALLEEVWASRMLSNFATMAQRLEAMTSEYLGSPHVLAVTSGDVGLMITLKALELDEGAPCFVSPFTFNSTINTAIWNRLRPVFVDIDPRTYNMDPVALADAMRRHRTPGTVLATHVFGNPCDSDAIAELASAHGHRVVYDAAHGYGSLRGESHVGTLGDAEVFSLSGTKLVTSAEGGLISTGHGWLAERVEYLRGYGFKNDYRSVMVGMNGKLSELHCALGLLTLAGVEEAVRRRHELVERYRDRLGDAVRWQAVRDSDRSTYKDVCLWLGPDRPAVEEALGSRGIQTKRYFRPLHEMPAYRQWAERTMPVTEQVYDSTLCVPAYADLDDATVDLICDLILEQRRTHPRPGRRTPTEPLRSADPAHA